jgi:2-oxoglutarate ferredoxin oxidoreductase subunit delta
MSSRSKTNKKKATSQVTDDYWKTKLTLDKKSIHLFDQIIFRDWCKACGICIAFCPKTVYAKDKTGKPVIDRPDDCNGCRLCELYCPDFAITIKERYRDRRRKRHGE